MCRKLWGKDTSVFNTRYILAFFIYITQVSYAVQFIASLIPVKWPVTSSKPCEVFTNSDHAIMAYAKILQISVSSYRDPFQQGKWTWTAQMKWGLLLLCLPVDALQAPHWYTRLVQLISSNKLIDWLGRKFGVNFAGRMRLQISR